MFGDSVAGKLRKYLAKFGAEPFRTFTASYPVLHPKAHLGSIALWALVFGCKATESSFFLTLSFCDSIAVMVGMKIQGFCIDQVVFTLAIMYVMDPVLFFLDTFLWYIVWNTVFSIARSFLLGLSIWTPWKDIYTSLPKRIYAKLLATRDIEIWNAIIISMYREHLLSIEYVQKLLYHQVDLGYDGKHSLRVLAFFVSQGFKGEFFPSSMRIFVNIPIVLCGNDEVKFSLGPRT
ncbi:putative beta-1,3-glucan synthase [Suillus cothurnatus]|nr:putative beta-1,3-glucan synthase [Suillus cothurnatus]